MVTGRFAVFRNITILSVLIGILVSFSPQTSFLTDQKKYARVRTAISEKHDLLEQKLKSNHFTFDNLNILLVVYKESDRLDLYAKNPTERQYKKILSYSVCSRSGHLGPKRKQGDSQVPEGFYHIDRFNPTSSFYLSLGINYPNPSDRIKGETGNLGGDIFIHGSCVTIGCIPMTDSYIKEIYLLAVHARNNGQSNIPVYIFPFEMNDQNMAVYEKKYKENTALINFWKNLKTGYDLFMNNHEKLSVSVTKTGDYSFNP